jgi:hypothetical protein
VERAVEERLARRRCERERAQVLREAGDAAVAIGQCPRLTRHARDAQWWEAERALRVEESREAQRQIEHGRDVLDAFWDSMEASRARRYVLISADLRVLGAVEDGVGVDAFIEQERRTRGDGIDVGFHLGAESEIIANWLKIRGGVYLEPARYSGARDRFHGTVGFDVRVVELLGTPLRAGFYVDGARNWVNWGLSVGAWH